MKTKNILRAFLAAVFVFGTLAIHAQTKIYVHKSNGLADEYIIADIDSISFTAPAAAPVDYSKLKLNEVSGVGVDSDKFYELINTGTVDINLEGCRIYYNANGSAGGNFPPNDERLTWTGSSTQIIKAGELFSLIGRNNPGSFTTGLTPERILIITLTDPDGNTIDQCIRAEDTGDYAVGRTYSFSRIPDGTGPFYFSIPTPNAKNGGSLLVPATPVQIPEADYSQLVINEIDGNGKFVEIYNKGTEEVSLEKLTLVKNEGQIWWEEKAGKTIAAGGYYVVAQNGGTDVYDEATGVSGISPKQTLKFELKKPNGDVIDSFSRGVAPWGITISDVAPNSFSRCPNGTGAFKLATPSPKAANPETGADIPQN
jgi:hypothetical protein